MKKNRVLMVAGGTGGHIFPALAVARALRDADFDVHWLGSHVGMESQLVDNEFPMTFISVQAIRGKTFFSKCFSPLRLCLAIWQAWRAVKKLQPDIVIGMGGFVSGPGGVAARLAGKRLVIHEQNAIAGMTNRLLSKHAHVVLQGFPNAFPSTIAAETVGNPVRPAISTILSPQERFKNRSGPLRLLVIGGSQGARAINQAIVRLLKHYPNPEALVVRHQTGSLDFEAMRQAYQSIRVSAAVEAFIDDMSEAYSWADLLICRAGALTVSEVAAAGVPSILIPFPYAADDHQYANGNYLVQAGAAQLIRQRDLTDSRLEQIVQEHASDRCHLLDIAEKARSLAKPQALSAIVQICQKLTKTRH